MLFEDVYTMIVTHGAQGLLKQMSKKDATNFLDQTLQYWKEREAYEKCDKLQQIKDAL